MSLFTGEWASVQNSELEGIRRAVGGITSCLEEFAKVERDTAKVSVIMLAWWVVVGRDEVS